jgi:ketosteroid isomerase-like protein
MSWDNAEIVRRAYDHLSRVGDFPWDLIDPEVEVHDPPSLPDSEIRHGREGLRAAFESAANSFDNVVFEVEQIYDAGDDVVIFIRMHARGKESGVDLDVAVAHLITLGNGKLVLGCVARLALLPRPDERYIHFRRLRHEGGHANWSVVEAMLICLGEQRQLRGRR